VVVGGGGVVVDARRGVVGVRAGSAEGERLWGRLDSKTLSARATYAEVRLVLLHDFVFECLASGVLRVPYNGRHSVLEANHYVLPMVVKCNLD
jgi:hypothetical protein